MFEEKGVSLIDRKKINIFHIQANLSLYILKAFLIKYKIDNYKIIFAVHGKNLINQDQILDNLTKILDLDKTKVLFYDASLNYKYLKFFGYKYSFINKIKKFIKTNDFNYFSSHNYGLVDVLISKKFKKDKKQILFEDGMVNWIKKENKYNLIKSILYSITLCRLTHIPKYRFFNNKNILLKIITFNSEFIDYEGKEVDLSKDFYKLIKKLSFDLNIKNKNKINILILCGKGFHYKYGISNFLINTKRYFVNYYNKNEKDDIHFYIKLHPSDTQLSSELYEENFFFIDENFVPIEFFNLENFSTIISPANTSMIYLNYYNLAPKNQIFYYDIKQDELYKKIALLQKLNINKIDLDFIY